MGWIRRSQSWRARRLVIVLPVALFVLFFLDRPAGGYIARKTLDSLALLGVHSSPVSGTQHLASPEVQHFWRLLRDELYHLTPGVTPIELEERAKMSDQDPDLTKDPNHERLNLIQLNPTEMESLRSSHDTMVELSQNLAPVLPYKKHKRGIVTTAGGNYFGMSLLSLSMLRRTGSQLPVTVFLDSHKDHDPFICDELLPSLNAECVVLSDLLDSAPPSVVLEKYQYKVFALLFSTYQEVLFLDADAFPAHNPDALFGAEPYRSTGMVTWPDFWVSTASPLLYDITRLEVPKLSSRKTSEAGILLYDKARHATDLLLALYYNFFGPGLFYPLLSQGAAGEGDKDTFLHAAMVMGKAFYDVQSPVTVMGRWTNETWHSVGMKQADPGEEWEVNRKKRDQGKRLPRVTRSQLRSIDPGAEELGDMSREEGGGQVQQKKPARPFFIHNNIVKLDVERLVEPGSALLERNKTGHWTRLWGSAEALINDFGYDVEKALWEEIVALGCELSSRSDCRKIKEIADYVV